MFALAGQEQAQRGIRRAGVAGKNGNSTVIQIHK